MGFPHALTKSREPELVAIWLPATLLKLTIPGRRTLSRLVSECGFDVRRVTSSHVLVSSRKHRVVGRVCEKLGDAFPSLGAHLILFATKG